MIGINRMDRGMEYFTGAHPPEGYSKRQIYLWFTIRYMAGLLPYNKESG